MELIIFWITSIILSFVLELKNDFRIIKDIADLGYKINIERLSELKEELNPNQSKQSFILMLIPIINILESMRRVLLYNNNKQTLLDGLNNLDLLEEMNDLEKKEYSKKPTGLNAIITPLKIDIKLENAKKHIINENEQESEIYYEYDEKMKEINILKVIGPLSTSNHENLKEIIKKDRERLVEEVKKYFGTPEQFIEENICKNNLSKEKNELIKLKEDIINSQKKEEKGPVLTKKKDKLD